MKNAFSKSLPRLTAVLLLSLTACVTQQSYNALQRQYDQLESAFGADEAKIVLLEGELRVTMLDKVLFPEGGYKLSAFAESILAKLVPTLAGLRQTKVVVAGYTDNVPIGPHLKRHGISTNMDLSSKRADEVVDYLIKQGVDPNIISAQGFGENRPVASNDTPEGRTQNRRIEVTLVGPGN
ncbi:MAG: OmpA/MotB family protein [Gammaproteobacteria bacterium]